MAWLASTRDLPIEQPRSESLLDKPICEPRKQMLQIPPTQSIHFEAVLEGHGGNTPPDTGLLDPAAECRFR